MIRTTISSALELLGLIAVVVSLWLLDWHLGTAAAGIVAVLMGLVLDPPRRPRDEL